MRKMKKVNGYYIVKFSDRERREWGQIGAYGVIDAELYTGTLEVDRGSMEYDDAETLEIAVELARDLESVLDVEEPEVKVTVIKETDQESSEEEVDPQLLIDGWETSLNEQVKSGHFPDVNPTTARHELYGFKVALRELGLLEPEDCFVPPDAFKGPQEAERRKQFKHFPDGIAQCTAVYTLGLALLEDCPGNDCRVYLNIFNMARELDGALDTAQDYVADTLRRELFKLYRELREMYVENYAVQKYKEESSSHGVAKVKPPDERTASCKECPFQPEDASASRRAATIPAELESGSIYARADALLEPLIEAATNDSLKAPDDEEAFAREKLLIYLAVLNRREGEAAGARHRGELTEMARLMETGYLEFQVRDTGPDNVVIEVFDYALRRVCASLTFRKIPFKNHYVLGDYRSL